MEILFILENSWFNYIGKQRKSSKNETPYYIWCVNIPYKYTVKRICLVQGGGGAYFNIKIGDDPIFVIFDRK